MNTVITFVVIGTIIGIIRKFLNRKSISETVNSAPSYGVEFFTSFSVEESINRIEKIIETSNFQVLSREENILILSDTTNIKEGMGVIRDSVDVIYKMKCVPSAQGTDVSLMAIEKNHFMANERITVDRFVILKDICAKALDVIPPKTKNLALPQSRGRDFLKLIMFGFIGVGVMVLLIYVYYLFGGNL